MALLLLVAGLDLNEILRLEASHRHLINIDNISFSNIIYNFIPLKKYYHYKIFSLYITERL